MGILLNFYNIVGGAAPQRAQNRISEMLGHAGLKTGAREWIGRTLVVAAILSVFSALIIRYSAALDTVGFLGAFVLAFLVVFFSVYLLLYFRIEERRGRVEEILPEVLLLMAANIRAGITPLVALRMAARPEFAPLDSEIKYVAGKSLGKDSFANALGEMSGRIKSDIFDRTVRLFSVSLKSGGNLPRLLEGAAADIRNSHGLRQSLIAGTNMYVVFIIFTVVIGMPSLLAVSSQFVDMMGRMRTEGNGGTLGSYGGIYAGEPISGNFVVSVSTLMMLVTSVITSMLIGVIRDGKKMNGLKYAPVLVGGALVWFYVMRICVLGAIAPV